MEIFAVLGFISLIAALTSGSFGYTREAGFMALMTVVCWVIAWVLDPFTSPFL